MALYPKRLERAYYTAAITCCVQYYILFWSSLHVWVEMFSTARVTHEAAAVWGWRCALFKMSVLHGPERKRTWGQWDHRLSCYFLFRFSQLFKIRSFETTSTRIVGITDWLRFNPLKHENSFSPRNIVSR